MRGAGVELADRQHGAVDRVDPAGNQGLQGAHHLRAHDDRVDREVRPRGVPAAAGDGDLDHVGGRVHRAGDHRHLAHRQEAVIVGAEHPVAGEAVEQPLLDHYPAAAAALLCGLEDEVHGAVEIARLGEVAGGTEQHRRMPVMAAGVHRPGIDRAVGEVVRLRHRQRIHVGAQADGPLRCPVAQRADQPGAGDPLSHLDAPGAELLGNDPAGAALGEAEFRVLVQVVPPGGHVGGEGGDAVVDRHSERPCAAGLEP